MKRSLVGILCAALMLSGCSTTRGVPLAEQPGVSAPLVQAGEKATLRMKSGERLRMKIGAVDASTLTGTRLDAPRGRTVQIALADVESMTVTRFSGGKTLGLVAGVVGGALVLFYAAWYASLSTCEDCAD